MLLLLLQTVTTIAPPSPVRVLPSAPPPIVITTPQRAAMVSVPRVTISDLQRGEPYTIDVLVRAGDAELWTGSLAVGGNGSPSTFRREQSEAGPHCSSPLGYRSNVQTSLNVQLAASRDYESGASRVSLTVRWSRPGVGGCPLPAGARTVELSETVPLAPGQTATVAGDAGLTVRLRRR
jgi:hypothetical protein